MAKREKVKVSFCGENASQVTGSMILITYKDLKILLECGLVQSNSFAKDYKANNSKLPFKPSELDYIFLGHAHIDHSGRLGQLYKDGCKAPIFCTHPTVPILEPLFRDSAYIMERETELMNKQNGTRYLPIYEECDVDRTLSHVRGCDYHELYELDEHVSFMFIPSGHIIGGAQLVLYIREDNGHVQKILYTSDLGNTMYEQPFVEPFEKVTKSTYVIGECTYADDSRKVANKNAREKDIEKIRTVIDTVCCDRRGRVLIPAFSLQRTQALLKMLYEIFGDDESFDIPIVVDSPLALRITQIFSQVLKGEDAELMKKILNWKNLHLIKEPEDSKASVQDKSPKVIISASGMATAGRVKHYLKSVLPDANAHILFCGFATEGSLAWRIKNGHTQKTINIDGKPYKNKANITNLTSFSGHMQHDDLLRYYGQMNTTKVYLVHGDQKQKVGFKKRLEEVYREQGKSTQVVATNKGTVATL